MTTRVALFLVVAFGAGAIMATLYAKGQATRFDLLTAGMCLALLTGLQSCGGP